MKGTNVYSPFYKIRKTLVLLRWTFGFPLQAKDESYTEFRFVSWLECLRFLVVCLMPVVCYVYWLIVLLVVDGNLQNLVNVYKESYAICSLNEIDQILLCLWNISAVVMSFSYLLLFKYNTRSINKFCDEVTNIKSKVTDTLFNEEEEARRTQCITIQSSEKLIIFGQIFNALTSLLYGIGNNNIKEHHIENNIDIIRYPYGSNVQLVYPYMRTIQVFFSLFGPMSCAVELIICQMVNTVSDLFKDWETLLRDKPRRQSIHHPSPQHINITKSSDDLERGEM